MNPKIYGIAQSRAKEFRQEKMDLKARGYPLDETNQFVDRYYEKLKVKLSDQLKGEKAPVFINTPSTSRVNVIPLLLIRKLIQDFRGKGIHSDDFFIPKHLAEAKYAMTIGKRNTDPIRFDAVNMKALKDLVGRNQVFIVDDLMASGESTVKFKKHLEAQGIQTKGYINLRTLDTRYATERDIERIAEKLEVLVPEVNREALQKDLKTILAEYPKQKANRIERSIRTSEGAKKIIAEVSAAAAKENELNRSIEKGKKTGKGLSF